MRNQKYVLIALLTVLISACGGSGSDDKPIVTVQKEKPEPTPVPTPAPTPAPEPEPEPAPELEAKVEALGALALGQTITLDGIESQLYDGVKAQWQWLQKPTNSRAELLNSNTLRATFIADEIGVFQAQLTLTDLESNTSSAQVLITIANPITNNLPQARFHFAHSSILINKELELDGSESTDADGDNLTYLWQVSSKVTDAEFTLQNNTQAKAVFSAQNAGVYTISLTVNDGKSYHKVSKDIQVIEYNHAPTILRLEQTDTEVYINESVYFTTYAEDKDGDRIFYQWRIVSRPENSSSAIQNKYLQQVYMVFDEAGEYVIETVVSDGLEQSSPKRAHVVVTPRPTKVKNNHPPYVGGITTSVVKKPNTPITLTAIANDLDRDELTYRWEMNKPMNGATFSFSNARENVVDLTVDKPGWYLVNVYAHDGIVESAYPGVTLLVVKE